MSPTLILICRFIGFTTMFICVGNITRSMRNVVSYYFSHMHLLIIELCGCVTLYFGLPIHDQLPYHVIPMCFQSLRLINKSTVTLPVEPSLPWHSLGISVKFIFWICIKMNSTLPFLGFVMLTFPMSYWVWALTTILGST